MEHTENRIIMHSIHELTQLLPVGCSLFFIGIGITATPFILATLVLRGIFKWNAVRALSAICGGMTSTPALGDLMDTFHTEDVATIYAASYPFALLTIILSVQIMPMIW